MSEMQNEFCGRYILLSEMQDRTPLPGMCPMTTSRKRRRYLATVANGKATSLQGEKSQVRLEIKEGCPKRAYLMEVRTDPSSFMSIIPDDECFISPIVTVLAPAETSTSSYVLRIPHCLDEDDDRTKVIVRLIHENRNPAVVEVPKGKAGALFYDISSSFIELHVTYFCKIICTICNTPFHCLSRVVALFFAKFETRKQKTVLKHNIFAKMQSQSQHDVEIRPYFCGIMHDLGDFREVMSNYSEKSLYFYPFQKVVLFRTFFKILFV